MVEFKGVSQRFGQQWALHDVSFALNKGEFLFLTGHSGAGKTTLLRLLYGALRLDLGRATVAGFDLTKLKRSQIPELRRRVSVVFQDFKILPNLTAYDNVALALKVRGLPRSQSDRRVRGILRAMGLEDRAYIKSERLSGGEQQRVAIARSMVVNPKLILADEPTGNLDADLTDHLMDIFRQFYTYGTTVIMATHSREVLERVPEARILHLEQGRIVDTASPPTEIELYGGLP
ncbi:MAG: cell division ATP-binding protein FtsE [Proteobacteria bacterium]|nr:cell division ATP-binding protein FtsE [Pseudomonadota bacterium]MBU1612561.1 cell division ATP-binding protein FtsE [Pseudomonadota bacterium]